MQMMEYHDDAAVGASWYMQMFQTDANDETGV